jgi:RimJ/RimL family protein N-acetyltransferase
MGGPGWLREHLFVMMVDSKYQGKGYETVALRLYLQQLFRFCLAT